MIYIEFYDESTIDNICSSLADAPERVYLLGNNKKRLNKQIEVYDEIFSNRGLSIEFVAVSVNANKLTELTNVLCSIIEKEEQCCIDLTGGSDLCLVASGIVFSKYPEKIQMHRFNINNNTIFDCDGDGTTISVTPAPQLTVEENIRLYGGNVASNDAHPDWELTEEFISDLKTLWEICKANTSKRWNSQIGLFEAVEKFSTYENDTISCALISDIQAINKYIIINPIISALKSKKLANVENENGSVIISYKNPQIRAVLTKAGQLLELMVYAFAVTAKDSDNNRIYCDAMTGVLIDWKGKQLNAEDGHTTVNEVDIIAMHDLVPIFISCKNGGVELEELYKLNTVAERFGGRYVKKAIVAASLDSGDASLYFKQRALDMGIEVVEPSNISMHDFEKAIRNLYC